MLQLATSLMLITAPYKSSEHDKGTAVP